MRVLVISRSFFPANRAASYRSYSWALYLKNHGVTPVFITRNWNTEEEVRDQRGNVIASGTRLKKEVVEDCDTYYVPYRAVRSIRYAVKGGLMKWLSKPFLILEHIREYAFWLNEAGDIYKYALSHIRGQDDSYDKILVTAPPYVFLKIGSRLSKETGIPWIADYRDEWNSRGSIVRNAKTKNNLLRRFDVFRKNNLMLEKGWLKSCQFITINTKPGVRNLKEIFPEKRIFEVPNGFLDDELKLTELSGFETFTMLYSGTLYNSQKVELLLDACKEILDETPEFSIRLTFVGLGRKKDQVLRIEEYLGDKSFIFEPTSVVSKEKALEMSQMAHVLLMFAHEGNDSVAPSKLYEYVSLEKPVLLAPSDGGVMQQTLSSTGQAFACETIDQIKAAIRHWSEELESTGKINFKIDQALKYQHNRKVHAEKLAYILKSESYE